MTRKTGGYQMRGYRWRLLPAALLAVLALSSCADIDARLTVTSTGSCGLKLHYAVSKMVVSLDAVDSGRTILPFPVSKAAFDRAAKAAGGTELLSYSQKETDRDLVVDAELRFASLSSLSRFLSPQAERAAYAEAGGQRSFRVVLAEGKKAGGGSSDPDLLRFVDAAFAPYSVAIAIRLPLPVKSTNAGKISRDGLEVDYISPVAAIAKSETPLILDIAW
jgi:hypothetical protein